MKKEMTCIICPNGCLLTVETEKECVRILGAKCERGKQYAYTEMMDPQRTVTTTVLVENGTEPLCSVRLSKAVSKGVVFTVMREARKLRARAPIAIGDVLAANLCGLGCDLLATRNVSAR